MKKINLRTVIEVCCLVSLWILLGTVITVMSVDRTITDSGDSSYTLIRNSNGHYWDPTGANLQLAINDLGNNGGSVWVGSDITLSSELHMRNYTTLDFEDHKVTLTSDISFLNLTNGVWYSTVRNVRISPSNGQTKSIIVLYLPPNGGWHDRIIHNLFENIDIINSYPSSRGWAGIHLYVNVGVDKPSDMANFLFNTFRKITMNDCMTGILLECDDTDAYGNGNNFDDIWIDAYVNGVWFKVDAGATNGFNQNLFNDIKLQTASFSTNAFRDISHFGNHFDHCLAWDWYAASNPVHEWNILPSATKTYICAHYIADILNQGTLTNIAN
jgi:hypothetical protein